jgi:hypothetical protein
MRWSKVVCSLCDFDELIMHILEGSRVGLYNVCCLLIRREEGGESVKRSPKGFIIEERSVLSFFNEMITNEIDVWANALREEEDALSSVEHGVPSSIAWVDNLQRRKTNSEEGLLQLDFGAKQLAAFECGEEEIEGGDHWPHRFQFHRGLHTELNGVSSAWNVEEKGQRFSQLAVQRAVDGFVVGDYGSDSDSSVDQ